MSTVKPCIFCDIVAGKSQETIIEFSNEHIVIFRDIRPASEHHYLAVPKTHMPNVRACTMNDKDLSMIPIVFCQHYYFEFCLPSKKRDKFEEFTKFLSFFSPFFVRSTCPQFLKCKTSYAIYSARKM